MKRREVIKSLGATSLFGTTFTSCAQQQVIGQNENRKKRILPMAHITDVHVQPEKGVQVGLEKCLHHIQSLPDRPDSFSMEVTVSWMHREKANKGYRRSGTCGKAYGYQFV